MPLRVAVVDDDDGIRRLVERVFAPPSYESRGYRNGREALDGIAAAPPDVVISDLNMPGMQGDKLCRSLHERLGALAPPVIILSCAGDEESVGAALEAGAVHYVTKPFAAGHLRKLVEHAVRAHTAAARQATPARSRETIGPYRILGELGRGGMGIVYRAEREDTGREVALKVRVEGASLGSDTGRFLRELSLLAMLDHPGIARFLDSGTDEKLVYYAMELVPGPSLHATIRAEGRSLPARVAEIGRDAAEALAYVHSKGVLHRDVKPANLVLVPEQRARLIDFGLAKRPDDLSLTGKHEVVGTLHYLAPEVVESGVFDAPGDVFALGLCLYEALLGHHPHTAAETENRFAVTAAYRSGALLPVGRFVPAVPRSLGAALDAALDLVAEKRPSAAALAAMLRIVTG